MALRLRLTEGMWIALCAAESSPAEGDIYIDDGQYEALSDKFALDFNEMFDRGIPFSPERAAVMEKHKTINKAKE